MQYQKLNEGGSDQYKDYVSRANTIGNMDFVGFSTNRINIVKKTKMNRLQTRYFFQKIGVD
jgi:hypothetical protein